METQYNSGSTNVKNSGSLTHYSRGYTFGGMTYGERLRAARIHAGLTQTQLSERIGGRCTQENISKLERSGESSEFTWLFAEACGVRWQWLESEDGDMLDSDGSLELVHLFRSLSPDEREHVLAHVRFLEGKSKPPFNDDANQSQTGKKKLSR